MILIFEFQSEKLEIRVRLHVYTFCPGGELFSGVCEKGRFLFVTRE